MTTPTIAQRNMIDCNTSVQITYDHTGSIDTQFIPNPACTHSHNARCDTNPARILFFNIFYFDWSYQFDNQVSFHALNIGAGGQLANGLNSAGDNNGINYPMRGVAKDGPTCLIIFQITQ